MCFFEKDNLHAKIYQNLLIAARLRLRRGAANSISAAGDAKNLAATQFFTYFSFFLLKLRCTAGAGRGAHVFCGQNQKKIGRSKKNFAAVRLCGAARRGWNTHPATLR